MREVFMLLKKSRLIGISIAICLILLSFGVAWAVASATNLVIESAGLRVEISKN